MEPWPPGAMSTMRYEIFTLRVERSSHQPSGSTTER